jgi:hypothetical protein
VELGGISTTDSTRVCCAGSRHSKQDLLAFHFGHALKMARLAEKHLRSFLQLIMSKYLQLKKN